MKKKNNLILILSLLSISIYAQQLKPIVNSSYNSDDRSIWIIVTNPTDKAMVIHNNLHPNGGSNSEPVFRFDNEAKQILGYRREVFPLNGEYKQNIKINPYSNMIFKYSLENIYRGVTGKEAIKSVNIDCYIKYSIPEKNISGNSLRKEFNIRTTPDLSVNSGYDSHNQVIIIILTNTTSKTMAIHNTSNSVQFRFLTTSGEVITTSYSALREQSGAFTNPVTLNPHSTKMFYYKYADMSQGINRIFEIVTVETVCSFYYDIPEKNITRALQRKAIKVKIE